MNRITLLMSFMIPLNLIAQINYDEIESKIFYSSKIDTIREKVLIVEKKYAIVYFKQNDLDSIIRNAYDSSSFRYFDKYENLIQLLKLNKQRIYLTDYWFDYYDADRKRMFGNINYTNQDEKLLGELIYFGGDLIHDNKAMIINKRRNKLVTKRMTIERVEGFYGTRYVEFRLPNGKSFWSITTREGL